ncbi:MAG: TolC family protein [Lacunisphaera sp.]
MPSLWRLIASLLFTLPLLLTSVSAQTDAPASTAEPLTVDDAVQRALAKNFAIKVSGFDASIAAAGVTESLGKFDPTINAAYYYSQNHNPLLSFSTPNVLDAADKTDTYDVSLNGLMPWGLTYKLGGTSTNYRGTFNNYADNFDTFGGVSGTQPLLRDFGFGATLASVRIARTDRKISEQQFRASVIDTVTQVKRAYFDLAFAHALLRSATRSRELATGLLAENQKRYKTGSMSEYDVTQANARAASREEQVLQAERQVLDAENFLKQLITDDRSPALLNQHFVIAIPPPAPVVVVDPVADFRVALDHRPDYQQARLSLERSGINRRLQRNQLLPRLDLVGSYGYNGLAVTQSTSNDQVRSHDYNSYSWGVVASIPLTFTTERGRYRAAKLREQQSEVQLQNLEQNIVVLVGNAAGQIETAQKRIQANRKARELAQVTLDDEVKRLRAGPGSTFFVAQQQELLAIAEVQEAGAHADYYKALAEYDRQLGVTLDKLNIKIEAPR